MSPTPPHDNTDHPVTVRPSGIEGRGVFAARRFDTGDVILRIAHNSIVDSPEDIPESWRDLWHWIDNLPNGRLLLMDEPERYINASCDPTAYTRFTGDTCEVVARRPLHPGDEITTDYMITTHNEPAWPCRCGAPRCRIQNPTSFFELPDAFLREYEPLLHDWFIAEHPDEYRAMCKRLNIQPRTS